MEFSIIIPTYDNYKYLNLAINSLKKNSKYNHEIIIHINGNDNETENFVKKLNLTYTKSDYNIGLCSGVNLAAKKAKKNLIIYAHDDMYFLPNWDINLIEEINNIETNKYFLSCTHISGHIPNKSKINHIFFDCGKNIEEFNEGKLLENYSKFEFYDLQGSHWAPHVIHKDLWNKIGGFSEEFDPGFGSDPDLSMKLWQEGVRIFKGVNNSRIYHFGSLTTRKNKKIQRNDANTTFLLKWGITISFFVKNYLHRGNKYNHPLKDVNYTLKNIIELFYCKIKYLYLKIKN
jgi:GT2 family glycosyltransferase